MELGFRFKKVALQLGIKWELQTIVYLKRYVTQDYNNNQLRVGLKVTESTAHHSPDYII